MKKTVRILLLEPKPLIADLTKKAIQSKPDAHYCFDVVGIATTAKAGYFELYKNQPHILFLDPDLPDEEMDSFIHHALERMPYLKIVGLASMLKEDEMMEAGAHDFISLPIQKPQIWRKLDELVDELDEIGLLEPSQEPQPTQIQDTNLFEFKDPAQVGEFNPLFEDLIKRPKDEEPSDTEEVEPSSPLLAVETAEDTLSQDSILVDDEPLVFSFGESTSPSPSTDDVIVDSDEEEFIESDSIEDTDETSVEEQSETPLFDFFSTSISTYQPPTKELETSAETNSDVKEGTVGETEFEVEEMVVEDNVASNQSLEIPRFSFEMAEKEKDNIEGSEEKETSSSPPLFELDLKRRKSNHVSVEEDSRTFNDQETSAPVFTFEPPSEAKHETKKKNDNLATPPIFQFEPPSSEMPREEESGKGSESPSESVLVSKGSFPPLNQTPKNEENDTSTPPFFQWDRPEKKTPPMSESCIPSSNKARTHKPLYPSRDEYNKATYSEKSLGPGYYNRNGQFVSLYPPRERFSLQSEVGEDDSEADRAVVDTPENERIFSVVKKIFKRH